MPEELEEVTDAGELVAAGSHVVPGCCAEEEEVEGLFAAPFISGRRGAAADAFCAMSNSAPAALSCASIFRRLSRDWILRSLAQRLIQMHPLSVLGGFFH